MIIMLIIIINVILCHFLKTETFADSSIKHKTKQTQKFKKKSHTTPTSNRPKQWNPTKITKLQKQYIAKAVFFEAHTESEEAKIAIIYVILNRMVSSNNEYYGKNINAIIFKKNAFSWVGKQKPHKDEWKEYIPLVNKVVATYHIKNSPVKTATHFVNLKTRTTNHRWWKNKKMMFIAKIESHAFYKYDDEFISIPGKKTIF